MSKKLITAPIVGATKMHHIADAWAAVSITRSAEEISTLEEAHTPHPAAGFMTAPVG